MATEFICAVGPGQVDYTTAAAWESGLQCDLTVATTKVFAGTRTGTIADDASVTGATSGATGTVVHCTATQILIESISGTFQSGEQIRVDVSNYFTASNAGDSAASVGDARSTGADDTSNLAITGGTSSTTNYIKFWTDPNASGGDGVNGSYRHKGVWPGAGEKIYRLAPTSLYSFQPYQNGVYFYGIAVSTEGNDCIKTWGDTPRIAYNLIKSASSTANICGILLRNTAGSCSRYVFNNIVYGFSGNGQVGIHNYERTGTVSSFIFANTVVDCTTGVATLRDPHKIINNLVQDCATPFSLSGDSSGDGYNVLDAVANGAFGTTYSTGTTTSAATGKLIDSGATFVTDGVLVGSIVKNTTDTTYTYVVTVDSETQLTVNDDIFASTEAYSVYTNVYGNVTFEDAGSYDFHLDLADTAARGKGLDLSEDSDLPITDDIDGDDRSGAAYDIGADQTVSEGETASGAVTIPAVTVAGSAGVERDATGAVDIPAVTVDGTAGVARDATGAITIAAVTVSGTASVTRKVSGAITIAALTVVGSATTYTAYDATGAVDIPAITASGTAGIERQATGSVTTAAVTVSGAAAIQRSASGAIDIAAVTVSGSAGVQRSSSGAVTIGAVSVSGTAEVERKASGAVTTGAVAVSGSAGVSRDATGAITIGAVTVDGTAKVSRDSSGAVTIASVAVSGTATISAEKVATGDVEIAAVTVSGTASITPAIVDFICTAGPGQVDYTTLFAWEARLDGYWLTASNTVVLSHSGKTGTMDDADTVTGKTSGATGEIIHCTTSQIAINVTSGTFQSGEQIYVTDGVEYVTSTSPPRQYNAICECATTGAALQHTSTFYVNNWTNDATHRVKFRAASGHEAKLSGWDTSRFRIETTTATTSYGIYIQNSYVDVEGLQIEATGAYTWIGISPLDTYVGTTIKKCRFRETLTGTIDSIYAIRAYEDVIIEGCIFHDIAQATYDRCIYIAGAGSGVKVYNCVGTGAWCGFVGNDSNVAVVKNCAFFNCGTDFLQGASDTIDYCASDDGDGDHSVQPADWDDVFEDWANGDYRLKSTDTDLMDAGIGPSSDSDVPTTDMDGDTRSGTTCDIGADEYVSVGETASGAVTVAAVTVSGTAGVERDAIGAIDVPAITVSGGASVERPSSGAVTVAAVTISGMAEVERKASGAVTTGAVTVSGSAGVSRDATGAITTGAVTVSGSAAVSRQSSGAVSIPAVTCEGTAGVSRDATGAVSVAAVQASGSAGVARDSTGAVTIGATTVSGSAGVARDATGAVDVPAVVVSGTAITYSGHLATGAVTIPATTASGTAGVARDATGDVTIGAATVDATATVSRDATGAVTIAAVEVDGTASIAGEETASGAVTIAAVTVSGTAVVSRSSSGAITITAVEVSGSAGVSRDATGAVSIPAITVDATGAVSRSASGAVNVPAITVAGQAAVSRQATGAVTIPATEAAGTAGVARDATGAVEIAAITVSGTAATSAGKIATGAVQVAAVTVSGTAAVTRTASGAVTVGAVSVAGTATVIRNATGAVTIPAVTVSGAATTYTIFTASGAVTIPAIEVSGAAKHVFPATGAVACPAVTVSGAAAIARTATGAVVIPSITVAGTVGRTLTATGAVTVPAVQASGTAVYVLAFIYITVNSEIEKVFEVDSEIVKVFNVNSAIEKT